MATPRTIRWISSAAVSLTLGAALLAAYPASAAVASRWHIAYRVPGGAYEVGGLTASGRNDAWAFVYHFRPDRPPSSYYLHWAGHGWKRVAVPGSAGFIPDLIGSAARGVVWILGTNATGDAEALHFNGEQWTLAAVPEVGNSLVVLGNDDVWIDLSGCSTVGGVVTCTTTVEHWDGVSWHASTLPVGAATLAGAGSHIWLAGSRVNNVGGTYPKGREAVFQRTSGHWVQVTAPDREIVGYPSLGVSPGGEVWMLAKNVGAANIHLDQRKGQRWSKIRLPRHLIAEPHRYQISYDGRDGIWMGSAHWTGARWVQTQLPGFETKVDAVSSTAPVPGTSSVWGIAQTGGGAPVSVLAIYGRLP
jgi:hypothetical protein